VKNEKLEVGCKLFFCVFSITMFEAYV